MPTLPMFYAGLVAASQPQRTCDSRPRNRTTGNTTPRGKACARPLGNPQPVISVNPINIASYSFAHPPPPERLLPPAELSQRQHLPPYPHPPSPYPKSPLMLLS